MSEPSSDPYQRAKIQLQYREEKLRVAVRNFNDLKREILGYTKAGRTPPCGTDEALRRLKEWQTIVRDCQKALGIARQRVQAADPRRLQRGNQQQQLERYLQQRQADFFQAVNAIEV
jgi:hypothetical protein